jgi:hypothetical protein
VFVCLNLPDARLTHGREYFRTALQQMPLSFDILDAKDMTLLQTSPALAQGGTSGGTGIEQKREGRRLIR